ncbi:hypothetical protein C8Q78DRAFT_1010479 [Trametes maxima]|nr:hypothetical protein C8Q78DRAFT_1010479 [Trametes maxima]
MVWKSRSWYLTTDKVSPFTLSLSVLLVPLTPVAEETLVDRELQSKELGRIMSVSYPQPVIFLGYVVTKPLAPHPVPYNFMVTDGYVHDINADDYDRWSPLRAQPVCLGTVAGACECVHARRQMLMTSIWVVIWIVF